MIEQRESRAFVREMKFLISPEHAARIQDWARVHMSPDPHAAGPTGDEYRVTSLYLDTPDFAVYDRRGSYGRSKYRVRRYGESGLLFLERKLKTEDRVGKLRSIIPAGTLSLLDCENPPANWPGRWFYKRVRARQLAPVCQISYHRMARLGHSESGPVRLTVDRDLSAQPVSSYEFQSLANATELLPGQCVLELKYKRELPGLFKQLLQEFSLRPQGSSKYRMGVQALELRQGALCLSS